MCDVILSSTTYLNWTVTGPSIGVSIIFYPLIIFLAVQPGADGSTGEEQGWAAQFHQAETGQDPRSLAEGHQLLGQKELLGCAGVRVVTYPVQ